MILFHPFFIMRKNVSQTQIFKFFIKIVKVIIMVIFVANKAKTTLLKWNTNPDCKGVNSRAVSKKDENRPNQNFEKMLLNSTLGFRTDKNLMRVLLRHFLIKIENHEYLFILFICMCVYPKSHKFDVES